MRVHVPVVLQLNIFNNGNIIEHYIFSTINFLTIEKKPRGQIPSDV